MGWKQCWAVLRATWSELGDDNAYIVASGVAFWVALAIFPGVAIVVWLASSTVSPDQAKALVSTLSDLMPDASRSVVGGAVNAALQNNPAQGAAEAPWFGRLAPVIGLTVTLWSTNSGMKALFDALNIVYDKQERRTYLRFNAVTLLCTLGTLLLILAAASTLLASPLVLSRLGLGSSAAALVHWLRWPALFLGFAFALSLLNRYAPNRERQCWPLLTVGSPLAAALLVAGTALFSWVTTRFVTLSTTYGSLSTVVAFLLWLWIDVYIVLACAELDSIIAAQTTLYGRNA